MTDQQPLVLYDAALGSTPDTQGRLAYRASPDAAATQSYVDGATVLDTSARTADAAGYFADPRNLPPLDRTAGYTLRFTVQVAYEDHSASDKNGDGVGDRAGFSVLVLSADRLGIELGFWQDQIWAQEEGPAEPPAGALFTRAEHAPFDTSALTSYTLAVQGDAYALAADERPILRGRLRDYTAFEGPVNPYRTPNFIFLGDDTGSAQAIVHLSYVALQF
jgi:hypothetical protein